jgi:hypothetical protein
LNGTLFSAQTLTAIELWLVGCIGFLFFSLIELGIVMQTIAVLDKEEKKTKKKYSFANFIGKNVSLDY